MNTILPPEEEIGTPPRLSSLIGLIVVIIAIAWFSIKIVNLMPGAFSSLASLAENLNKTPTTETVDEATTFTVTSNTTLLGTGKTAQISWDHATIPGSYTFSYTCTEGVAIDLVNIEGLRSIDCDTNYNIGDIESLSLTIYSEKGRYVDVPYSISFLGTHDTTPRGTGTATITVVNSNIQDLLVEDTKDETKTDSEATADTATTKTDTAPTPVYKQEYTYTIPTSDPNGRTDLATKFLTIGNIVGNTFFAGEVKQNETGAIQFEVKNYGTKTSGNWTFTVSLPTGDTYTSDPQTPLKPNERAVLSVGFKTGSQSSHIFMVNVSDPTDQTIINNNFKQPVTFAR